MRSFPLRTRVLRTCAACRMHARLIKPDALREMKCLKTFLSGSRMKSQRHAVRREAAAGAAVRGHRQDELQHPALPRPVVDVPVSDPIRNAAVARPVRALLPEARTISSPCSATKRSPRSIPEPQRRQRRAARPNGAKTPAPPFPYVFLHSVPPREARYAERFQLSQRRHSPAAWARRSALSSSTERELPSPAAKTRSPSPDRKARES